MVLLPEGCSGDWKIEHFTVGKEDASFEQLRAVVTMSGRGVPAGTYMRLMRGNTLVMSNTRDEIRDLLPLKWYATGHVLIAGLGLGCALQIAIDKPSVEEITVVEKSPDVLALVAPHFQDPRVRFIEGDIFDWKPDPCSRYGAAWFDIWDNICADNLEEMARLHRRFARKAAWKGSWCRDQCRRYR